MVKDRDTDQVTGLTEPGGKDTIFGTGFRFAGGMIVGADDSGTIQEDGRFEDFARMDGAERQGADRNDVHADDGVFGIQTGDKELLTIETVKEWTENGGGAGGIADDKRPIWTGDARHELERVARNKKRVRLVRSVDDREL